jgi:23S rRNA (uracil1939-C5)-methyltransferase
MIDNLMKRVMTEFSTDPVCCASLASCFGCAPQERILAPASYSEVKNFFNTCAPEITVPLIHKELTGWRTRAKLAVRGTAAQPEIGLFQQGTHQIIPLPHCPLHHPAINRAYKILYDTMKQRGILPYCEKSGKGSLRYVQFVVERRTRRVQLTLVAVKEDLFLEKWVKQLYIEGGFQSIWLNFQPKAINTIFGERWKLCEGEHFIEDRIADVSFYFHPACFMQAHLSLFEELIRSVQKHMLKGKRVLDLYAGVGVIGLNCAASSQVVTCVENSPFAQECFDLSLLKCSPEIQKKAHFLQGAVEKYADAIDDAEVIIVDPPRKGLDAAVLQAILRSEKAEQIIYISCHPLSFFRDCTQLLEKGWKVVLAETYLMFPGSDHVELLCILEKEST